MSKAQHVLIGATSVARDVAQIIANAQYLLINFTGEFRDQDGDLTYAVGHPGRCVCLEVLAGLPYAPPQFLAEFDEYQKCREALEAVFDPERVFYSHLQGSGPIEDWENFENDMDQMFGPNGIDWRVGGCPRNSNDDQA